MSDQERPIQMPRGVADETGQTAFIADGSGGISAIDLGTGAVLWRSTEAARPLLAFDDRLAASRTLNAHTLQVVLLDAARKGAVTLVSEPVVFPDWVTIGAQNNQNFALEARRAGGDLLLDWEAHAFYRGGAAPSQKLLEQAVKQGAGAFRVDLDSGRVSALPPTEARPRPAATTAPPAPPTPEPGAQEIHRVGPRLYYLVVQPMGATNRILMRARDVKSGELAWELPLEQKPISKPPPLRP